MPTSPRHSSPAPWRRSAFAALPMVALLTACTTWKADERIAYWRAETAAALPPGTLLDHARSFFAARGLEMRCSDPAWKIRGESRCSVFERDIGHGIVMQYSALIEVDSVDGETVSAVRVARLGLGF